MPRAKKKKENGFPVKLQEYLTSISKPEMRAGFQREMKDAGETKPRYREEWDALLRLYETKPTGIAWTDWVESQ
jgi:hypothetical protein